MDIRRFFTKTPMSSATAEEAVTSPASETSDSPEKAKENSASSSDPAAATASMTTPAARPPTRAFRDITDLGEKDIGPKRPELASFPKHLIGNINRAFSVFYYSKYPWLEYSVSLDSVFCFSCRQFSVARSDTDELFTKVGARNWKKMSEKLAKHSSSQVHLTSMQMWDSYKRTTETAGGSVAAKLSHSHQGTVEKNRDYLSKSIAIVKLLAKLGLPFRGHREDGDSEATGNYRSICAFFSKYDPDFQLMQSKYFNCTSGDFQNEIIAMCAELVREEIANAVQETGFFAVIADEAKSSKTEQLSVCIRYTEGLQVKERFICFIDCSDSRSAAGIVDGIKNGLRSCGLQDIPIIAQSYDGASVMSGHLSGV